jgi:hypothetical protein
MVGDGLNDAGALKQADALDFRLLKMCMVSRPRAMVFSKHDALGCALPRLDVNFSKGRVSAW